MKEFEKDKNSYLCSYVMLLILPKATAVCKRLESEEASCWSFRSGMLSYSSLM